MNCCLPQSHRGHRKILNPINLCALCDSVVRNKLSVKSSVYAPYADWAFDDIHIVSDYLGNTTTTYAYNGDNEMTSMTACNETTNFSYDNWGRMDEKYTDDYEAEYMWRYDSKLYTVDSDFPGEDDVTYQYGGDGKRRSRNATGNYTWFNYGAGWNLINEETGTSAGTGTLTKTHIGRLAEVAGNSPSTGSYKYYVRDNLGSARALYDQSKSILGNYEYTPYGNPFAYAGPAISDLQGGFTGHKWEQEAGMYYAPYRYYSPGMARWAKRDPLGMVDGPNLYGYVGGDPINAYDPSGLRLFVCRRNTVFSQRAKHLYLWSTRRGRGCGQAASGGETNNLPPDPDRDPDAEEEPGGSGPGPWDYQDTYEHSCFEKEGVSAAQEDAVMDCCEDIGNNNFYLPFVADCHVIVHRCLRKSHVDPRTRTGGRFGDHAPGGYDGANPPPTPSPHRWRNRRRHN